MARHQPAERLGASWLVAALLLLLLDTRAQAQDTSAILSGILGSLTSTTKARGCPGECVHAITALLCDHVVDEIQCGASYLRCCVPKDLSLGGTAVETSAPLAEEEALPAATTPATAPVEDVNVTVAPPTAETPRPPEPSALPSATSPRDVCPGVCVGTGLSQYCHRVLSAPSCGPDAVCCTSADGPPEAEQQQQQQQQQPVDGPPQQPARDQELPECPGSCVSPLLSILCDHVSTAHSCPTGGSCCISAAAATTTEPPAVACDGRCLPPFLSGVCQKPAQLVLRTTTCPSGSICCSPAPFFGGGGHPSQQRPFGAIIPRPYRPQDNAVIPVDQAMVDHQLALQESHRRPQHEQQLRPLRDQGAVHPVKQNVGPPRRLRPSQHHPPGFLQRPGPRPPSPSSMDFQAIGQQPPRGLVSDEPSRPLQHPEERPTESQAPHPQDPHPQASRPQAPHPQDLHPQAPHPQAPLCPGNCISSYLRFACFGEHAIHPGLRCPQDGVVCCANVAQVQRMAQEAAAAAANQQPRPTTPAPPTLPPVPEPEQPDATPPEPPAPSESPSKQRRPKPPTRDALVSNDLPQETQASTEATPASTTRAPSVAKGRRPARPFTCGVKGTSGPDRRRAARITGGKDSLPGEWCWQAALVNSQNQYLCGGALIGSLWVLTAAHCVTSLVRNGEPVFVRVGDHDLGSEHAHPGAQTRRVATTYIHHNHNGQSLDNDIALLKLQEPVQLNSRVCPVCLPARGAAATPGNRCTVTGYGYLGEGGPIALRVREAVLPVVGDRECTAKINAVTEKQFLMPASSYCAGGEKGNDACQGDGGGPMVCLVDGFYELTGLVSWGFGCGRPDVPGVYVKVSAFIGWINQIISVNNL